LPSIFPGVLPQKKQILFLALYRALFNLSSTRLPVFVLAFLSSPVRSAIETQSQCDGELNFRVVAILLLLNAFENFGVD
jgi:hypothetical protein